MTPSDSLIKVIIGLFLALTLFAIFNDHMKSQNSESGGTNSCTEMYCNVMVYNCP